MQILHKLNVLKNQEQNSQPILISPHLFHRIDDQQPELQFNMLEHSPYKRIQKHSLSTLNFTQDFNANLNSMTNPESENMIFRDQFCLYGFREEKMRFGQDLEMELLKGKEQCSSDEQDINDQKQHTLGDSTMSSSFERAKFIHTQKQIKFIQQNKKKICKSKRGNTFSLGLKSLSKRVLLIVQKHGLQLGHTAQILIHNLTQEGIIKNNNQKEKNNIKRRVYDAINVLLSIGVLYKLNKNLSFKQHQPENKKVQHQQVSQYKLKKVTFIYRDKLKKKFKINKGSSKICNKNSNRSTTSSAGIK